MKRSLWQSRPYTEHTGFIGDLRQKIPTFTISDFRKRLTKNTTKQRGVDLPMLSQAILSLHYAVERDPESFAEFQDQQIPKFSEVKKDVLKKRRKKREELSLLIKPMGNRK